MNEKPELKDAFYTGLRALEESAFPKTCSKCGGVYSCLQDFIDRTSSIEDASGLTELTDKNDRPIIGLRRLCECGQTLVQGFRDRRDTSDRGIEVRKEFGDLISMLEIFEFSPDEAREELLKILHGQRSDKLDSIGFDIGKIGPSTSSE